MSESHHSEIDSFPQYGLEFKLPLEHSGSGHSENAPLGENVTLGESLSTLGDSSTSLNDSVSLLGKTEQEIFELKNIIIRNKDKWRKHFKLADEFPGQVAMTLVGMKGHGKSSLLNTLCRSFFKTTKDWEKAEVRDSPTKVTTELQNQEILTGFSVIDNIGLCDIDAVGVKNAYNKLLGGSILSLTDKQNLLNEVQVCKDKDEVESEKQFSLSKTSGNIPPPTTCVCFVFSAKDKLDINGGPYKLLAKLAKLEFPRIVVLTNIMEASPEQTETMKSELKLHINPIRIFEIENYVVQKVTGEYSPKDQDTTNEAIKIIYAGIQQSVRSKYKIRARESRYLEYGYDQFYEYSSNFFKKINELRTDRVRSLTEFVITFIFCFLIYSFASLFFSWLTSK
jgi:GTPase SAR1 family protein